MLAMFLGGFRGNCLGSGIYMIRQKQQSLLSEGAGCQTMSHTGAAQRRKTSSFTLFFLLHMSHSLKSLKGNI